MSASRRVFAIQRVLGIIVAVSSLSKLPPAALGFAWGDGTGHVFLSSFALSGR